MSDRDTTSEDDRILRSAKCSIAHVALGPEGDRLLFRQLRERQQQQRRARVAEANRAFASEAAALAAMATAAQQSSQTSSSGAVGSTVAQTLSQSTGVMASQPIVLTSDEIAIQQAALQEAQLQKALGEIKAEKERMIRRRARMQRRQADVSENQLVGEANINMHNFPSFSKKALDLEAKIGHGQTPTTDGRKKSLPPNWKAKGRIMFVDNNGFTIELDDDFQAGVGSERDKPRTQAPLGLLKPLPIPERPGESLSMDFMDMLVTSKSGMRYVYIIVDRFSKYARLVAMPTTTKTEYVIKLFKENWVKDFGLPKSSVSDRDVRFTSELWKTAAAEQGTQLQMTSGNHPEANGQAEQLNRAVQHLLRDYIKPNQVDWDEKLALIASLYNNVVHSATGMSPNSLLLTFKPRLPSDFLLPKNQPSAAPGTLEFAYQYEHLMQLAVE
ncbi:hypothetical protein CBR_g57084 [Chara braunii]|uniref:Integrase catalytic domain-containing protein n=1 Tax=Chara braunii TaxID=69332 RepID=A0A388K815_CHABU|nr:hypothetical protein CBR_g57084 [Chara braunii]|eukprot:GBG66205.1 hypothetical protein CBR_g57084 [Chara braunii]